MQVNGLVIALVIGRNALAAAGAEPVTLFDFEEGTQEWAADWGLEAQPETARRYAAHGQQSLLINHAFGAGKEAVAVQVILKDIGNFTARPGFEALSAWVYLPTGSGWEAQVYVRTGPRWRISWGAVQQQLGPGWHRIAMRSDEIADPSDVRTIGVQVKNFSLSTQAKVYVDYVQALYR